MAGSNWCAWHAPERKGEYREWARKGGKARSNVTRLRKLWEADQLTPAQLSGLLSGALVATLNGEIEPAVLTALAGGARALITVQQAAELEARLQALEAAVERGRGRTA
ncbi:MAG TPA: hypothetical protein VGW38_29120 [Chloroflexota bacterium]|nr:hypothetical protein [Chloroflexota bacterium]